MATKISFALNRKEKRTTRKRPLDTAGASGSSHAGSALGRSQPQLSGCFDATQEDEDANRDSCHGILKHPRLRLEDVRAKSKRLQDEGNTLAEAGRFRAAMARWMEAVEVDPENAVIHELLAQACMALCEDFRAIQFALKATQLDPAWGDGFHTLARCHLNYGELELALEHAIELLGLTDELLADRQDIQSLLEKQQVVIAQRDAEASGEGDEGKLQAISCLKHLSLRGQTKLAPRNSQV